MDYEPSPPQGGHLSAPDRKAHLEVDIRIWSFWVAVAAAIGVVVFAVWLGDRPGSNLPLAFLSGTAGACFTHAQTGRRS